MNKERSMHSLCKQCGASCCKRNLLAGSPILSFDEVSNIIERYPETIDIFCESMGPDGSHYCTMRYRDDNRCYFLTSSNHCGIDDIKPLACACYPLVPTYRYNNVSLAFDKNCPVTGRLHYKYVRKMKEFARRSIRRFSADAYRHWQENNCA